MIFNPFEPPGSYAIEAFFALLFLVCSVALIVFLSAIAVLGIQLVRELLAKEEE